MFLGRFGDSHVAPYELFDPTSSGPPAEAWDVQLRVPASVSAMLDALHEAGRGDEAAGWWAAFSTLSGEVARRAQADLGYVTDASRGGAAAPARLSVTVVVDEVLVGVAGRRPHVHVYLGATGESLVDGARWPVSERRLWRWAQGSFYGWFRVAVEEFTARELGVTIGAPQPGASHEVVDPPWHEHIGDGDRGVCIGRWGPRRLVLADEQELEAGRETAAAIAADEAAGRGYRPPQPIGADEYTPRERRG